MAAIAVRAVGKERVVGLVLPEKESNPVSSEYALKHAQALGIEHRVIDITPTVDSVVPYEQRDAFIRELIPAYQPGDQKDRPKRIPEVPVPSESPSGAPPPHGLDPPGVR